MLGIGSGSFDPETLVVLETAFDEAWITLKSSGSSNIRPNELARRICHLAMEGERDPVRLHDRALGELIPATTWRELSQPVLSNDPGPRWLLPTQSVSRHALRDRLQLVRSDALELTVER